MAPSELCEELEQVLSGDPWYGSSVIKIIEQVDSHKIFRRKGKANNIVEILLHMIAWTEEVNERLKGKPASIPGRGDWPDPAAYTWIELIGLFMLFNQHLKDTIVKMDDKLLSEPVTDTRNPALGTGVTREALIKGLIQHHIYHAGQIAVLNK